MHDAGEKQDEFEDEDDDDKELEELATGHRCLLDGESIDIRKRAQLLLHTGLPLIQSKARRRKREESRRVDVAHNPQWVLSPIRQLVDVDEKRMDLAYGSRAPGPPPLVPPSPAPSPAGGAVRFGGR